MNFWKLRRECTTGPMHAVHGKGTCFHDGNIDSIVFRSKAGGERAEETVAEVWPTAPAIRAQNDTRMLVHCYNRFPGLLSEAISVVDIVKWAVATGCPLPDAAARSAELQAGIKKALNVKVRKEDAED